MLADEAVGDEEIDAFIAGYVVPADDEEGEEGGGYDFVEVDGIRVRADQADRLLSAWRGDADIDAWLVPVNPELPRPLRFARRIKYVRTVANELTYLPLSSTQKISMTPP